MPVSCQHDRRTLRRSKRSAMCPPAIDRAITGRACTSPSPPRANGSLFAGRSIDAHGHGFDLLGEGHEEPSSRRKAGNERILQAE